MAADLGINEKDRLKIVEGLSRLLADSYTLYLKTHNFHWNVTGPVEIMRFQIKRIAVGKQP